MGKLIGVADAESLTQLKRWLLLVDEIAVVHDEESDWTFRDENPSLASDLDWLTERGIVSRVHHHADSTVNIDAVRQGESGVVLIPTKGAASIQIRPGLANDSGPMTVGELLGALSDILCRLEAATLRSSGDIDAVSLRSPSPHVVAPKRFHVELGNVHHVTINAMPEPSEMTSLDHLLEFRNYPEAKGKLMGLRRWMTGMAKTSASPRELANELEWLLYEYQAYMRVRKMKIRKGILETVITGAAEVAENLVKIKWGELAKILFAVSARRIELLEAELNAPGREIAYVAHAWSKMKSI